jgi:hypothetical protein
MAVGNMVKTNSVEFSGLKNLKYEVQVKEIRNFYSPFIFKAPDNYSWSTIVELKDCIVAGTDKAEIVTGSPWPNPCTTEIFMKDYEGQTTFTNQLGQSFVVEGNEVFNVSDLPRGLYIITYEKEGRTGREKILLK